jgi:hypothetical protein
VDYPYEHNGGGFGSALRPQTDADLDDLRGTTGMSEAECMALASDPTTPPARLEQLAYSLAGRPRPASCGVAARNPNLPTDVLLSGLYTGCLDSWRNPTAALALLTRPDAALRAICWGLVRIAAPSSATGFDLLAVASPYESERVPWLRDHARHWLDCYPDAEKAEALAAIEAVWAEMQLTPEEPTR